MLNWVLDGLKQQAKNVRIECLTSNKIYRASEASTENKYVGKHKTMMLMTYIKHLNNNPTTCRN